MALRVKVTYQWGGFDWLKPAPTAQNDLEGREREAQAFAKELAKDKPTMVVYKEDGEAFIIVPKSIAKVEWLNE